MRSEALDDPNTSRFDLGPGAYAGLVSRLTALVVDVLLLTVASLVVSILPGLAWNQILGDAPGWLGTSCATVAAALPWAYFTAAWRMTGQTAGGLLVGTAVVRRDGRRVSLIQAAARSAIGLAFAPVWLVGLVGVLWSRKRRAWHDVVFRTVVRRIARDVTGRAASARLDERPRQIDQRDERLI